MVNPMNCETCDYKHIDKNQLALDKAHCYMFREAPSEVCRIHTGFKESVFDILAAISSTETQGEE